jgi:hypothetical protein
VGVPQTSTSVQYDTVATTPKPLPTPTRERRIAQHGHLWLVPCRQWHSHANRYTGLLPLLKSIQKPCNLKKYAGQTIGVDAYGWLHRGTAACAIDLALDKPTTKYVASVLQTSPS